MTDIEAFNHRPLPVATQLAAKGEDAAPASRITKLQGASGASEMREAGKAARCALLLLVISSLLSKVVQADDLGVIGPTYPIAEQHLLDMITQRLRALQESGKLARLRDRAIADSSKSVTDPAPVAGLAPTKMPRSFWFDPTYVLEQNILDSAGHILFPAGTRTNPLSITPFSRQLLFFDAREPQQVRLAKELMKRHGARIKPVLVGGAYLQLMRRWKTRLYYDQQGLLVRRFGIRHVPALVSQDGLRLRVDEVVAP